MTNTAAIASDQTTVRRVVATTTVHAAPLLHLRQSDAPDPVPAGGILTYTLSYSNTGNETATQVVISDTLDPNVTLLQGWPAPDGGSAHRAPHWTIGNLAPDGHHTITLRVSVTLPLTNGTALTNTAAIASDQTGTRSFTEVTTVTSAPFLTFDQGNGVQIAYAGDRLTYTLTYTNGGNENAYAIVITDTLPDYVTYTGCTILQGQGNGDGDEDEGCRFRDGTGGVPNVIFTIPTLAAQTTGQAQVVVQVIDPLPAYAMYVINHAWLTAPCLPTFLHVEDVDPIGSRPDLSISVAHTPNLFVPDRSMTYTLSYANAGRMDADGVIITATLPTNTVFSGPSGWYSLTERIYAYDVGELPAGAGNEITCAVHYTRQVDIGLPSFRVPFHIRGRREDANPTDNIADLFIGVPDLVVTDFSVEPLPLRPDTPLTFTVILKNRGTGMAWNPSVQGGFWLDIFIAPVVSYPFDRYSELGIYAGVPPLAPGATYTLVITQTGPPYSTRITLSPQEWENLEGFYVKADNFDNAPYGYGLVPEENEWNNLGPVISRQAGLHTIYLPLIKGATHLRSASHLGEPLHERDEKGRIRNDAGTRIPTTKRRTVSR